MVNKVLIIAEAGVNHNGSMKLAYELIDAAAAAGVDIVKFQTFKAENLVTKTAVKAEYQNKNTGIVESQLEMLKKLELSQAEFSQLKEYCKTKNIEFLSTAFDMESLEFLKNLGLKIWKIPSGEITNLPYLEFIGKLNHKTILSTGMCNLEEIGEAIDCLVKAGTDHKNITVLHCTTEYPTPMDQVNLKAMNLIKNKYKVAVGYSDHTKGIEIPVAAVALGAEVIEKHFTLDKTLAGPDHKASLDPSELKAMVESIRNIEIALGVEEKKLTVSEEKNIKIARKSIVAKTNIKKGETLSEKNLTIKRPGTGISPMKWYSVIGQAASKDYSEDELI